MSTSSTGSSVLKPGRPKRRPVHVSGLALALLSFQTLGIIYSDIGTSPLYVLNGIWSATGPVLICLHFGTQEGEGGPFALYHGIFPPKFFESTPTHDSMMAGKKRRDDIKPPQSLAWPLLIWALFGTSLTMADGVLTAAVSVTSAVGGIAVAKPSVASHVVAISIAFLLILFLSQPLGTARLSFIFAPVTFVWLLLLAGTGIFNITKYPGIFRAFDPSRAVMYFVRTGDYDTLAGVLLAITGCEALFANLGQFNMLSIQISFSTIVYPSLVLAYLGQGSRLIVNGESVIANVFYLTIPGKHNGPLFWIVYVYAILATLIASQAMITASFSLVQQLVNMRSLPPLHMVHTSDKNQGQLYIPVVNWILMIVTIVIVAAFNNATQLTNAYGFAVATVMFTTTVLIAMQIRYVKHLPIIVSILFFLFFGFFDGLFWGASLKKIPQGAWVPLIIGLILLSLMSFWTWAKGLEDKFDLKSRRRLEGFIVPDGTAAILGESEKHDEGEFAAVEEHNHGDNSKALYFVTPTLPVVKGEDGVEERRVLSRLPLLAIYHGVSHERGVPPSFTGFLRQWPALPTFGVFLTTKVLPVPHVNSADRYVVSRVEVLPGFYGVAQYLGFRDQAALHMDEVIARIGEIEERYPDADRRAAARARIEQLVELARRPTHVIPHYAPKSRSFVLGHRLMPIANYLRRVLIEDIYGRLSIMFPEGEAWLAPADEIIHVGITATI
ncbi:potassium transporter [Lactarius quietus]|nr:potassium transporter [Lactarius quietus]